MWGENVGMVINELFYSLQGKGRLVGVVKKRQFKKLFTHSLKTGEY